MTFRQTRLAALIVVFVIMMLPVAAMAQSGLPSQIVPEDCNQPGGCQSICDIALLAQNLLNYGIFLAVVLSAVLFAYAGWRMITSGGNTEIYAQGKRVFGNVLIGIIIILAGWIVVDTLMNTLLGTSNGAPWNKICQEFLSHFEHFYA